MGQARGIVFAKSFVHSHYITSASGEPEFVRPYVNKEVKHIKLPQPDFLQDLRRDTSSSPPSASEPPENAPQGQQQPLQQSPSSTPQEDISSWFEGSKVMDAQGEPLQLSPLPESVTLDEAGNVAIKRSGHGMPFGEGYYFIANSQEAMQKAAMYPNIPGQQRMDFSPTLPAYAEPHALLKPYTDRNLLDPEEIEGLYHVTTNKDKVLRQGLLSRSELPGVSGLGGGARDEAPHKVSVTWNPAKAHQIEQGLKLAARTARGELTNDQIMDEAANLHGVSDEEPTIRALMGGESDPYMYDENEDYQGLDHPDVKAELESIKTPQNQYKFLQDLDRQYGVWNDLEGYEGGRTLGSVGFTAPYKTMRNIDPSQVATFPVRAVHGAEPEYIPEEHELRFDPRHLEIDTSDMQKALFPVEQRPAILEHAKQFARSQNIPLDPSQEQLFLQHGDPTMLAPGEDHPLAPAIASKQQQLHDQPPPQVILHIVNPLDLQDRLKPDTIFEIKSLDPALFHSLRETVNETSGVSGKGWIRRTTGKDIAQATRQLEEPLSHLLSMLGYDGIHAPTSQGDLWVAFKPDQVKMLPQAPAMTKSLILFKAVPPEDVEPKEPAQPFYSNLTRALNAKMPENAPAEQVKGLLNSQGIAKEEQDYSGIHDYLNDNSGKVKKSDVLAHVEANLPKLQEVWKGTNTGSPGFHHYAQRLRRLGYTVNGYGDDLELYGPRGVGRGLIEVTDDAPEQHQELVSNLFYHTNKDAQVEGTRHDNLTLPGGSNYKELLLTLPESKEAIAEQAEDEATLSEMRERQYQIETKYENDKDELHDAWKNGDIDEDEYYQNLTELEEKAAEESHSHDIERLEEKLRNKKSEHDYYKQAHWNEPNIIGHIRMNERESAPSYTPADITDIERRLVPFIGAKSANSLGSGAASQDSRAVKQGIITPLEAAQYSHYRGFHNDTTGAIDKILHLEEAQSDWHQDARNARNEYLENHPELSDEEKAKVSGYKPTPQEFQDIVHRYNTSNNRRQQLRAQYDEAAFGNKISDDQKIFDRVTALWDAYKAAEHQTNVLADEWNNLYDRKRYGVPDAPFKKNWHELLMKRALHHAAEIGADKLTWTTGKQQIDRYEDQLRQNVDHIIIKPGEDGKYYVNAFKDGEHKISEVASNDKELRDLIGMEGSKRALQQIQDEGSADLEGDDLAIGGEGMKGFYDKILPQWMSKYVKKWGGEVGQSKVNGAHLSDFEAREEAANRNQDGRSPEFRNYPVHREDEAPYQYIIYTPAGDAWDSADTLEEAQQLARRHEQEDEGNQEYFKYQKELNDLKKNYHTVHHVTITPQMRKELLEEGQPLWGDRDVLKKCLIFFRLRKSMRLTHAEFVSLLKGIKEV